MREEIHEFQTPRVWGRLRARGVDEVRVFSDPTRVGKIRRSRKHEVGSMKWKLEVKQLPAASSRAWATHNPITILAPHGVGADFSALGGIATRNPTRVGKIT